MASVIAEVEKINFPKVVAKKLKSKKIKFLETKDGILIKPINNISAVRGILKGTKFNTQVYSKMKEMDKTKEYE